MKMKKEWYIALKEMKECCNDHDDHCFKGGELCPLFKFCFDSSGENNFYPKPFVFTDVEAEE